MIKVCRKKSSTLIKAEAQFKRVHKELINLRIDKELAPNDYLKADLQRKISGLESLEASLLHVLLKLHVVAGPPTIIIDQNATT